MTMHQSNIVREIADLIGEDMAERIALKYAGERLYLSTRKNSPLEKIVGKANAKTVCDYFGGDYIEFPLGDNKSYAKKKAHFFQLLSDGYTIASARRLCGVARRTGTNWAKDYRLTDGNLNTDLPLFNYSND